MEIFLAIILGTSFGIALDQAGASDPQKIIGMLRLKDFHLMKVILFAIGFSSLILFILLSIDVISAEHLSVKKNIRRCYNRWGYTGNWICSWRLLSGHLCCGSWERKKGCTLLYPGGTPGFPGLYADFLFYNGLGHFQQFCRRCSKYC